MLATARRWTAIVGITLALVLPLATSFQGSSFGPILQLRKECSSLCHRAAAAGLTGSRSGLRGRMPRIDGLSWLPGSQSSKRSGPLTMVLAAEEAIEFDEVDLRNLKVIDSACEDSVCTQILKINFTFQGC
jgi:hypothetical protein